MSLAYGWTPREIGKLSLAQAELYWVDEDAQGASAWIDAKEARARQQARRGLREAWTANVMRAFNDGISAG